jgi:hypothetical protein
LDCWRLNPIRDRRRNHRRDLQASSCEYYFCKGTLALTDLPRLVPARQALEYSNS